MVKFWTMVTFGKGVGRKGEEGASGGSSIS